MSFGFGFGEFVKALELVNDLYHKIYLVARNSLKEFSVCRDDIGLLSKSIQLLTSG